MLSSIPLRDGSVNRVNLAMLTGKFTLFWKCPIPYMPITEPIMYSEVSVVVEILPLSRYANSKIVIANVGTIIVSFASPKL